MEPMICEHIQLRHGSIAPENAERMRKECGKNAERMRKERELCGDQYMKDQSEKTGAAGFQDGCTGQKRLLRRKVKTIRENLSREAISRMSSEIQKRIEILSQFQTARTVFLYMDLPGEVQMKGLIGDCLNAGKKVAVPCVEGQVMHFYRIESFDHLVRGKMDILEPDPDYCPCMDEEEDALMILPGLAFDRSLHRVGYGGGFYDRYLADHRQHMTVAVAFECQIFDEVPFDERDICPRMLVTEKEIYFPVKGKSSHASDRC